MLINEMQQLRGSFLPDRNAYIAQGEPLVFHCHHYNTYLQNTLEDAGAYLDVHPILTDSAQEIAHSQFTQYFGQEPDISIEDRKTVVEDYFRFSGFGLINLHHTNESGGEVSTTSDHYGVGYQAKYGQRPAGQPGVSFFTAGFLAGATEAIYGLPLGSLAAKQRACIAKGDPSSDFTLEKTPARRLSASPREGNFQQGQLDNPLGSAIDYEGIRGALTAMPIEGGRQDGLIDAFGVLLTRMYANYYGAISYRFLKKMEAEIGEDGAAIAKELLVEAGHNCAFHTFGGVMESAEWHALIKPMIRNREDWVHGIVACVDAFGWGFWQVTELVPYQKLTIRLESGYEANSFLKTYGTSSYPVSFLATGGTAGIMNLIYNGDITTQPELSPAYYQQTFKSEGRFSAVQTKCRAMGDAYDEFTATRVQA